MKESGPGNFQSKEVSKNSTEQHTFPLDLTIDALTMERLSRIASENETLLIKSNEELDLEAEMFARAKDVGAGDDISVAEYLERHPEILEQYQTYTADWSYSANIKFTQRVRKSSPTEKQFLADARKISNGLFGEVMIVIVKTKEGRMHKEIAYSAKADHITQEDIDLALSLAQGKVAEGDEPSYVHLVHNHPDQYKKLLVKSERNGPYEGFISTNSLSRLDIKTADKIREEKFPNIPVEIVAVAEHGLTYEYDAGTSEKVA